MGIDNIFPEERVKAEFTLKIWSFALIFHQITDIEQRNYMASHAGNNVKFKFLTTLTYLL
jgi:hypothetical protein